MGMIEGKVAILTGSGRGIGAATAKMFGAEGASVVVSDLDPTPAEETAAAIHAAGGKAVVVAGDVTDPAFPSQLIQATLDSFGGIDIIVNNAGYTWDAVIQNMTDKQWYAMLDVHTTAKTLAKEWGRYNVQVNCVCYGFIETRLTASKESAEKVVREGEEVQLGIPDQMRQMAPLLIPLGRPGTPEEAAGPVLFLASPLSNYVSGIVLEVTGGRAI